MTIAGFQSLSLLDYPGVICSMIFTQGCPFRCVYCHNPELIPKQPTNLANTISEATILDNLKQRRRMIDGVCITGGEPTVHPDLPSFIKKIKALGLLVKLDTNGVNPRLVERLMKDKLIDYLAMDLKHVWERYSDVIGINQPTIIKNCQATMAMVQASTLPHEFRTTVYSALHTEADLQAIAGQLKPGERYAMQEIRYDKTLDANLKQTPNLDLQVIGVRLKALYPSLEIEIRA